MIEKLKILSTMLKISDFTVAELAQSAGAKETTVRTLISREMQWLTLIGEDPAGRPGGVPKRYRVNHSKRDELSLELRKIYREINAPSEELPQPKEEPFSLIAAESIISGRLPGTEGQAQDALISQAQRYLLSAEKELEELECELSESVISQLRLRITKACQKLTLATPPYDVEEEFQLMCEQVYPLLRAKTVFVSSCSKDIKANNLACKVQGALEVLRANVKWVSWSYGAPLFHTGQKRDSALFLATNSSSPGDRDDVLKLMDTDPKMYLVILDTAQNKKLRAKAEATSAVYLGKASEFKTDNLLTKIFHETYSCWGRPNTDTGGEFLRAPRMRSLAIDRGSSDDGN